MCLQYIILKCIHMNVLTDIDVHMFGISDWRIFQDHHSWIQYVVQMMKQLNSIPKRSIFISSKCWQLFCIYFVRPAIVLCLTSVGPTELSASLRHTIFLGKLSDFAEICPQDDFEYPLFHNSHLLWNRGYRVCLCSTFHLIWTRNNYEFAYIKPNKPF